MRVRALPRQTTFDVSAEKENVGSASPSASSHRLLSTVTPWQLRNRNPPVRACRLGTSPSSTVTLLRKVTFRAWMRLTRSPAGFSKRQFSTRMSEKNPGDGGACFTFEGMRRKDRISAAQPLSRPRPCWLPSRNRQLRTTQFVTPMPSHQRSVVQSAANCTAPLPILSKTQSSIVRSLDWKRLRKWESRQTHPFIRMWSVATDRLKNRKRSPLGCGTGRSIDIVSPAIFTIRPRHPVASKLFSRSSIVSPTFGAR